ncbi:MAG: haloacid dehalogenase type II [Hyphomicrobiaceae bacterium]|nr:haloacid dehalogenase type II [Hyphomicrobiaceae bacterium]
MPAIRVKACVFDAYGTLFDFASAAAGCRDVLGDKTAQVTAMWRDKQLQYTWLRGLQGRHADFAQVTGDALDYTLETLDLADPALRERLMGLYLRLATFPEVPGVLRQLKADGYRTAILSNGSPSMLASIVDSAGLAGLLDHVVSVEEVGVFKPHPSVYQRAVDRLGVTPGEIAFMSSNSWDAWAASAFGMRVFWCNRYGQRPERLPGRPDAEMRSLAELPRLIARG